MGREARLKRERKYARMLVRQGHQAYAVKDRGVFVREKGTVRSVRVPRRG